MQGIPDAPWIRDAELNGMPSADPVICPVCGEECETIYLDEGCLNVLGCDNCIRTMDAYDWFEEQKEEQE